MKRNFIHGECVASRSANKDDEWQRFLWQASDWDVKTYLDCLP